MSWKSKEFEGDLQVVINHARKVRLALLAQRGELVKAISVAERDRGLAAGDAAAAIIPDLSHRSFDKLSPIKGLAERVKVYFDTARELKIPLFVRWFGNSDSYVASHLSGSLLAVQRAVADYSLDYPSFSLWIHDHGHGVIVRAAERRVERLKMDLKRLDRRLDETSSSLADFEKLQGAANPSRKVIAQTAGAAEKITSREVSVTQDASDDFFLNYLLFQSVLNSAYPGTRTYQEDFQGSGGGMGGGGASGSWSGASAPQLTPVSISEPTPVAPVFVDDVDTPAVVTARSTPAPEPITQDDYVPAPAAEPEAPSYSPSPSYSPDPNPSYDPSPSDSDSSSSSDSGSSSSSD